MIRAFPLTALALLALSASGCTQFPELDAQITPELENADFAELRPVEPLLVEATAGRVDTDATEAAMLARIARLRARAAQLQRTVLTGPEQQRLERGLT